MKIDKHSKATKTLVKYLLITIAGIALYTWGAGAAYIERGYRAYGGECIFLLLLLWYWLISGTYKDFKATIKNNITEVTENE